MTIIRANLANPMHGIGCSAIAFTSTLLGSKIQSSTMSLANKHLDAVVSTHNTPLSKFGLSIFDVGYGGFKIASYANYAVCALSIAEFSGGLVQQYQTIRNGAKALIPLVSEIGVISKLNHIALVASSLGLVVTGVANLTARVWSHCSSGKKED